MINLPYIKQDNYFYYTRTEADKKYPIHCHKMNNTESAEEILLDVNKLAASKKFPKISALSISLDHKLMAYAADFSMDVTLSMFMILHMPGFFYTPTK